MGKKNNRKSRRNKNREFSKHSNIAKKDIPANLSKISVCMIVKDEENFLDQCLMSVKEIADEIIIVDTGSKDNTIEIARKYTDKIYFHQWNNSFSEARNHSLKYATGEWIFQIDADEELIKDDIPVLFKALKNPEIDAIMVQIVSSLNSGKSESRHNVERIFRNNGKIHYEGRVHNRLVGFENPGLYPVRLMHYGYDLDKETSEMKFQRRIELLKKDRVEDPANPLIHHYLGCAYHSHGLYKETLESSLSAIKLAEDKKDSNPIFLWSRYNAAMSYYKLKDYGNTEQMALSAIEQDSSHIDSHFVLTLVYYDQKKWQNMMHHANLYLKHCERLRNNPEDFGTVMSSSANMAWNILVLMGISSYENGDTMKAEENFQAAISDCRNPHQILRAVGIYYYNKGVHSEAGKYLKRAYEIEPEDSMIDDILKKLVSERSGKPTISCCMIVKNEEEFLEKCLSSVKDYVDEIIIVDTGSTDSTVEIAKKFTDRVYFHAWENSFSKARNQAMQYATKDWIFQIDGDEELMEGSGGRLRQTVENTGDHDVVYVKILCSYANGSKVSLHNFERLFRNNGKIHYEGSVHNRVVGWKDPFYSEIELWHYGYDVEEQKAQEKFERTTKLLKGEIEKDPENPLHHHYLSASYVSRGLFKEALEAAQHTISLVNDQQNVHSVFSWTYFIASMALYKMGRFDQAREYAVKALEKYPEHMDSYYILTVLAGEKGEWDDVLSHGKRFLQTLEKFQNGSRNTGLVLNNTMNEGPAINMLMGHACHYKHFDNEMDDFYNKAYEIADEKWRIHWNIGSYHMDTSLDMDKAKYFLNLAIKEAPEEHDAWYMMGKLNNKCGIADEERICLEKVVEIGTEDSFVFTRLFSLYLETEQLDKALKTAGMIENTTPDVYSGLLKLGTFFIEKGQLKQSIKSYMTAAEKIPGSPDAWISLGEITLSMGRLEESQSFFETALNINNRDTGTVLGLCELHSRTGDIYSIVKYADMLMTDLDLSTDRTVNSFEDLKEIFNEINSAQGNRSHSMRINEILKNLPQAGVPAQMETQTAVL